MTKAQQQLELLSAGSENDPELQRDLAAAYERMGELRVDPAQPAKANAAAALDAYRRAVAIRRKIDAQPATSPQDRRDLALSLSKLGDGEVMAADMDKALAAYQESWTIAKSQGDAQGARHCRRPPLHRLPYRWQYSQGSGILPGRYRNPGAAGEVRSAGRRGPAAHRDHRSLLCQRSAPLAQTAGRCATGAPGHRILRSS